MTNLPATAVSKAAIISEDLMYRYSLLRRWDGEGACLAFVMLNPSTADAELDDPTIRRCMGFARREGYPGIHVLNLYAYRTAKPAVLWAAQQAGIDIVGPDNDSFLYREMLAAVVAGRPVVAAWGANARSERVAELLEFMPAALDLRCLGRTKDGIPRHPLMLANAQRLEPYDLLAAVRDGH